MNIELPTEAEPVKVVCGDALDVLPELPPGAFGAVVTDPPYGTGSMGGGYGRSHTNIECDESLATLVAALPAITKSLRKDSWVALFTAVKTRFELEVELVKFGLAPLGEVVWDKGFPGLGYHIRYAHETVLVRRWGKPCRPAQALLSVFRQTSRGETEHPHEKPVALLRKLIAWASCPGDLILDPFGGSGTTAVAALHEGRRCLIIEKDPTYCDIIQRRVKAATDDGLFAGAAPEQPGLFDEVA